jgi:ureidoacrylate peracid hydrolase
MARTFDLKKDRTALVIVDMQNDFVRKDGAMRVDEAFSTIEPIQKLIRFARDNNIIVVFTRFLSGPVQTHLWNWSPETEASKNCRRNHKRYYSDIDKTLECADVIDELKPILPADYVIDKYGYSSFRNTNLADVLASEGRDTIIVAGTVTQICVADTVHDAFHLSINAVVASDCVSSFSELQQKAILENVAHKYGMVLTSEEIIEKFS